MKAPRTLRLVSLALSIACAAPAQNLLVNGGFESPVLPMSSSFALPVGASLDGWDVGGNGNMILVSEPWPHGPTEAIEGAQFMTFNGQDQQPGQILSQTFQTIAGQWYNVRFTVGRGGPGSGSVQLLTEVRSDAARLIATVQSPAPVSGWGSPTVIAFRAESPLTTLTFRDGSQATASVDLLLDDVSVELLAPPRMDIRCAPNLLMNGSFELPEVTAPSLHTTLPNWVLHSGFAELAPERLPDHLTSHGRQILRLRSEQGNALSQTFDTVAGSWYRLRFSVRSDYPVQNIINVRVISGIWLTNIVDLTFSSDQEWATPTIRFQADSTTTMLRFFRGGASADCLLDDVSVEPDNSRPEVGCSDINLCWLSWWSPAVRYQIQYSFDLMTWINAGMPLNGNGGIKCVSDSIPPGPRAVFYRIVVP